MTIADTMLSGLGVSIPDQMRRPSTQAFPRRFNGYAASIWMTVCHALDPALEAKAAWYQAIEDYISACSAQNVFPMKEHSTGNADLKAHLMGQRQVVIDNLMNVQHPLLDEYTVLEIDREAEISHKGFSLKVKALFKNDDPTFRNHLLQNGFIELNDKYIKNLGNVFLAFWEPEIADRWYVSYTIVGPHIPEHLGLDTSTARLEKVLVKDMWHALTRECRPTHTGPRFV